MDKKHCIDKNYLAAKANEVRSRMSEQEERKIAERAAILDEAYQAMMARVEEVMDRAASFGLNVASYPLDDGANVALVKICLGPHFKWPEEREAYPVVRVVKQLLLRELDVTLDTSNYTIGGALVIRW